MESTRGQDLRGIHTICDHAHYRGYGDAQAADAWHAAHLPGIDGYARELHGFRILWSGHGLCSDRPRASRPRAIVSQVCATTVACDQGIISACLLGWTAE